jgi:hypothetical protein
VSCCCEKLVAEVGDSSGTQRKGNAVVRSRYGETANEETVDTGMCMCNSEL